MARPRGSNITAEIVPNDDQDRYPTHLERWGQGGLRTAATVAERNAITAERRGWGMEVKVLADGVKYELVRGLASLDLADNANWRAMADAVVYTAGNQLTTRGGGRIFDFTRTSAPITLTTNYFYDPAQVEGYEPGQYPAQLDVNPAYQSVAFRIEPGTWYESSVPLEFAIFSDGARHFKGRWVAAGLPAATYGQAPAGATTLYASVLKSAFATWTLKLVAARPPGADGGPGGTAYTDAQARAALAPALALKADLVGGKVPAAQLPPALDPVYGYLGDKANQNITVLPFSASNTLDATGQDPTPGSVDSFDNNRFEAGFKDCVVFTRGHRSNTYAPDTSSCRFEYGFAGNTLAGYAQLLAFGPRNVGNSFKGIAYSCSQGADCQGNDYLGTNVGVTLGDNCARNILEDCTYLTLPAGTVGKHYRANVEVVDLNPGPVTENTAAFYHPAADVQDVYGAGPLTPKQAWDALARYVKALPTGGGTAPTSTADTYTDTYRATY